MGPFLGHTVQNKQQFRKGIQERFQQTDQALEDVPTWPNVKFMDFFEWDKMCNFFLDWPLRDFTKIDTNRNNWGRWFRGI